MSGTGCNMRNKKVNAEDIVSICVISLIILLLLVINVTGSL
jgi:hypothetical protein